MQHRRIVAFGAVVLLALLAGCSASGSVDMRPVNDTVLADRASRSLDSLHVDTLDGDQSASAVVNTAISNGSMTVTALSPPIDSELPIVVEGRYYELQWTVIDQRTANAVSISIDGDSTVTNGTTITYAELPPADKAALAPLLDQRGSPRPATVGIGTTAIYTDTELDSSVLVPTQQYDTVIYEGKRYTLEVDTPRSVTVKTYRYEATHIANTTSSYAAFLRETYAFELSNLTDAERSVIKTAIEDGGYYAESTADEAFENVVAHFRSHRAILEEEGSGLWLVRYRGDLYLADLEYGEFLEP